VNDVEHSKGEPAGSFAPCWRGMVRLASWVSGGFVAAILLPAEGMSLVVVSACAGFGADVTHLISERADAFTNTDAASDANVAMSSSMAGPDPF
jgi:hypothetical protein